MFTGHYLEMGVCLSAYCIAMAVLVVCVEVSAQQWVYMPQCALILMLLSKQMLGTKQLGLAVTF
jgi:hypothetical protein